MKVDFVQILIGVAIAVAGQYVYDHYVKTA